MITKQEFINAMIEYYWFNIENEETAEEILNNYDFTTGAYIHNKWYLSIKEIYNALYDYWLIDND